MFLEGFVKKILNIWISYSTRSKRNCFSSRVEKELGSLHPGKDAKKLVYDFYLKKISFCCLIIIVGMGFLFLYVCSSLTDTVIRDEHYLKKEDPMGAEKTIMLDAEIGEMKLQSLSIPIDKKELSDKEIQLLFEELSTELSSVILGENTSLSHVDKPLCLLDFWDKAPIQIYWESSDRDILAEDGSLNMNGALKEGKSVILTATMIYGDLVKEKEMEVMVYSPVLSKEEEMKQKVLGLLDKKREDSKTEEYLELPNTIDGNAIVWKEPVAEFLPVLALLLIVGVAAVFAGKDSELHKEYEKRNNRLLLEYPEFVGKLQLMLCSGMSVRSAFSQIGKEYQKRKKKGGKVQYVCEELLLALRKMENGMPETEALKFFGERCNLFCYKKLVSLVLQNLKRGTEGLRESMMNESRNAFEERKQTARKLGEEAGTKLLLPMMMMMGIVLVMIVIPAYFSFGGMN